MKNVACVSMVILTILLASCSVGTPAVESPATQDVTSAQPEVTSYGKDIQPIFNQNCTRCHGQRGGLSLDSYEHLMAGGVSGPVIVANDANESLLVKRITGEVTPRMPQGGSLTQEEIDLIKGWIGAGALDN
jgi:mono/diheme cytochrome c family protein